MQSLKHIVIVCFITLLSLPMNAQSDSSNKISLTLNNASLRELVTKIEAQTDFHFYYDTAQIGNDTYSINVNNRPLKWILNTLFDVHKIYYNIDNDYHIFLSKGTPLAIMLPEGYFTGKIKIDSTVNNNSFVENEETNSIQEALVDKKFYNFHHPW